MTKLLIFALLVCVAVRWTTGAWPWQWLSSKPSRTREIARARRLLQIAPTASGDDIRAAYRRLAGDMHPDRGGGDGHLAALTEARDLLLSQLPETRR